MIGISSFLLTGCMTKEELLTKNKERHSLSEVKEKTTDQSGMNLYLKGESDYFEGYALPASRDYEYLKGWVEAATSYTMISEDAKVEDTFYEETIDKLINEHGIPEEMVKKR